MWRSRLASPGTRLRAGRAWLFGIAICAGLVSSAQADISLEAGVKATYLYKFAPFVEWPPTAFASPNAPLTICIAGTDPFGSYIDQAVKGQDSDGHAFAIRRYDTLPADANCQILFVSPSQTADQTLGAVDGKPVLTVTDGTMPSAHKGIIQFVLDHGRIRFDIDDDAAARSHLTISSKLLSVARTVISKAGP